MKKSILVLCDYPLGYTGNSGMANTIINQIDPEKYDLTIGTVNAYIVDTINTLPFPNLFLNRDSQDIPNLIQSQNFHFILIVGHDLWFYKSCFKAIKQACTIRGTRIVWLFPYELLEVRKDFLDIIEMIDYPLVYSQYGYYLLKPYSEKVSYFRPALHYRDIRVNFDEKKRKQVRAELFPNFSDKTKLIGFIGKNQIRKDPQKVIKAFSLIPDTTKFALYLHTNLEGSYNLTGYMANIGNKKGRIFYNDARSICDPASMTKLYNSFDVLVLPSLQEGLSWTPIEAMLCGCPVVMSDTSAHRELAVNNNAILIPCDCPTYLPIDTPHGQTMIDANCCRAIDIMHGIFNAFQKREELIKNGLEFANAWCDNADDINIILNLATKEIIQIEEKEKPKHQKILFVQHSSAGDVLMTTQCFKGIKEKHKDVPLVYMTQEKFKGIIEDNPYVDEIIDWDIQKIKEYALVYNPHGEKILPGGWNNLDVKLYSMYPYFCKVESDEIFIRTKQPANFNLPPYSYIVVNTSGASKYRQYSHFNIVFADFQYPVVQLGSEGDLVCYQADYDFRDKLSYSESAYVMEKALAAVTIDSFCSHLAGAFGTPQVCLFGPAPARVTGPKFQNKRNVKIGLIEMQPNMLDVCNTLAHCWSTPPNGVECFSPCINSISPFLVRKNLLKLIGENK